MILRGKRAIAEALGISAGDVSRYRGPLITSGIISKAQDGAMILSEERIVDALKIVRSTARVTGRLITTPSSAGGIEDDNNVTSSARLLAHHQGVPRPDSRLFNSVAPREQSRTTRKSPEVAAYNCMEHVLLRHLVNELLAFYTGLVSEPFNFVFGILANSDVAIKELDPGERRTPLLFVRKIDVAVAARLFSKHKHFDLDSVTIDGITAYYGLESIFRSDADSRGRYATINRLLADLRLNEQDPRFYRARHYLARRCPEKILLREGAIPITYKLDSVRDTLRVYARDSGLIRAPDEKGRSFYLEVIEHLVRGGTITDRISLRELERTLMNDYALEPFGTVRLLTYVRDLVGLMKEEGIGCSFDSAKESFLSIHPEFRAK